MTKIKSILLSISIAIVLFSFIAYLIQAIRPSPKYDDYCDVRIPRSLEYNQTSEETQEEIWKECSQEYDEVMERHNSFVFIIAVIAGLVAIVIGILLKLPSVSSGLMLGGTFLIIYGTSRYWGHFSNWIKTIVMGIVLMILIWLGYNKLKT